jgi:hypothetical protein
MKKVVVKVLDEASLRDLEERAETSGLTVKTVIYATLKCATCCAIGPDDEEKIDSVTGSLALLKRPRSALFPEENPATEIGGDATTEQTRLRQSGAITRSARKV